MTGEGEFNNILRFHYICMYTHIHNKSKCRRANSVSEINLNAKRTTLKHFQKIGKKNVYFTNLQKSARNWKNNLNWLTDNIYSNTSANECFIGFAC